MCDSADRRYRGQNTWQPDLPEADRISEMAPTTKQTDGATVYNNKRITQTIALKLSRRIQNAPSVRL